MPSLASGLYFSGKLMGNGRSAANRLLSLEKPVYQFRGFELEPAERRLSLAGEPIALTPKVFDTLVLLVERAGHIVTKDELMKSLWPRGYVDESNLTKNIWRIRRALNDSESDSALIETVPKAGYRFVAPVTRLSAATPAVPPVVSDPSPPLASQPAPPSPLPRSKRRRLLGLVTAAAVLVLALAGIWELRSKQTSHSSTGHTVAVVGFSNLSENPKDAWLAPALTEMLGAELSAGGDLEVVPDELVRAATPDLSAPAAGGYATATLERLRTRLDTDYVMSGSYLVGGGADDAPVRVDIALQDARNGALVASVSSKTTLPELLALVARAGETLRTKLGSGPLTADTLERVANLQPPTLDVARHIGFALDAQRTYDPARQRDELLQAISEAPRYAPAYALLAQAWSALGYHDKAIAAAEQAARWSVNLPAEQRLQAQAALRSARGEWKDATKAWLELIRLRPANVEYRLAYIDAQCALGDTAAAEASLAQLRQLAATKGDPRIELAAATLASARDDMKTEALHARLALNQAQQREAPGLVADAQLRLGWASERLGDVAAARTAFEAAINGYRSIRNPRGEAAARAELANGPLTDLHLKQEAQEELQRALSLDQSIGNKAGMTRLYSSLCSTLWDQGDRDGALAAAQQGLALARETGDLTMQQWMLRAEANVAADDAATDDVVKQFREVADLDLRGGYRGGHSWSLASLADVERLRGNLNVAHQLCTQALSEAAGLSDIQFVVYSNLQCAKVAADRGETSAARAALDEVIRRQSAGGDAGYANDAKTILAQLDVDEGNWSAARQRLQEASRAFAAADMLTGEANAQALLALCEQALGNTKERDAASARARLLRRSITAHQEIFAVDILLAQLPPLPSGRTPVQQLMAIADDAGQRHWLSWSLEAQLAAWELERATDTAHSAVLKSKLEGTARQHGFGRVISRLDHPRALLPATAHHT